jgi:hypothetical protein
MERSLRVTPPCKRVGPEPFVRPGLIISAVAHGTAVLLAVLFTSASPFDSVATEAITVDIISPDEVPPDQPQAAPEEPPGPPKEPPPELDFDFNLAMTPPPPLSMPPPMPSAEAKPVQPPAKTPQGGRRPASAAALSRGAAMPPATPQPAPAPPILAQPPTAPDIKEGSDQATSVADLFGMPLALPDGRLGGGFDAPAIETARIDRSSVEALRAHMRTCAALPAGVSRGDKISLVVRVKLNADGTLAGSPTLIEGTASPKGPVVLQSLLSGLAKCQPYNMLPADKYQEWKSLDMRFTPEDLGQG